MILALDFKANEIGSIGAPFYYREIIKANTKEDIINQLYSKYEHISFDCGKIEDLETGTKIYGSDCWLLLN